MIAAVSVKETLNFRSPEILLLLDRSSVLWGVREAFTNRQKTTVTRRIPRRLHAVVSLSEVLLAETRRFLHP